MTYTLDTNTISTIMAGDAAAIGKTKDVGPTRIFIPQPALAEIRFGLSRLRTSKRKTRLENRLLLILNQAKRSVWDDHVSSVFGEVKTDLQKRGVVIEDFDIAIAAHALAHDSILVSANMKHMSRVRGLRLENWNE